MTIAIQEDLAYLILKKIDETGNGSESHSVEFHATDFAGHSMTEKDLLSHLDYLNQKGYIQAEFSGASYGSAKPAPALITLQQASLTQQGKNFLQQLEQNLPESIRQGRTVPIAEKDMPFLEAVKVKAGLPDIYDARELAVVVFRTMRDMMTTESSDRVASELHEPALLTKNKTLQNDIAELWQDTNPVVSFISRLRPPLTIHADTFLRRIRQEGTLPQGVTAEMAVQAVFAATKKELSIERQEEISSILPGQIRELWHQA